MLTVTETYSHRRQTEKNAYALHIVCHLCSVQVLTSSYVFNVYF